MMIMSVCVPSHGSQTMTPDILGRNRRRVQLSGWNFETPLLP